jgi:exopolysaccharide/PEP-CTERM locus tyrosine autokinase
MSKLQKALQKLRTGDDPTTSQREVRQRNKAESAVLAQQLDDAAQIRSREQRNDRAERDRIEDTGIREKLPDTKLQISLETLQEFGLQPRDESLEQVSAEFRRIKRPVLHTAFGDGSVGVENANVIMMASALPKTGKTFCSFTLAISIARERDFGAVLVDADVLKPNISRVLGLENHMGLIDYLLDSSMDVDDVLVPTNFEDIVVVPAGQRHEDATELLASRRMEQFVKSISARFRSRAIIVDTPPLLLTNEAHVLAEHMGQIALVIEAGNSSQESVLEALGSLNRSKPINAILNKARGAMAGGYNQYGYGYGYGYYAPGRGGRGHENAEE